MDILGKYLERISVADLKRVRMFETKDLTTRWRFVRESKDSDFTMYNMTEGKKQSDTESATDIIKHAWFGERITNVSYF